MKLTQAISQATRNLIKSKKARTYHTAPDVWGESKSYTLELEQNEDDKTLLHIITWGWDYETIRIPQTRQELIAMKVRAQLEPQAPLNQIIIRYCLHILRLEADH